MSAVFAEMRRIGANAPLKHFIAEHFSEVDLKDEIEVFCFGIAIASISQAFADLDSESEVRKAEAVEWINEVDAIVSFDRACGQLQLNARAARDIIARMFPEFEARGPLRILKPRKRPADAAKAACVAFLNTSDAVATKTHKASANAV